MAAHICDGVVCQCHLARIYKISSTSDVRLSRYCKFSSGCFYPPWFFTCGENLVPMRVKALAGRGDVRKDDSARNFVNC